MKIVIIGATSRIAEHCARLWVKKFPNIDLVLVGRSQPKLATIASDLAVRNHNARIQILLTDFLDTDAIAKLVNDVSHTPIDIVLIAQGFLPRQSDCDHDLHLLRHTLEINAISPALFAMAFADEMEKVGHGTLAVIGSVAGDRGRTTMTTYGSAKALLQHMMEGLQHRFSATKIKAILIKPGPTETPMADMLREQGRKNIASVESVAEKIVNDIDREKLVIYAPEKWRYIMAIARVAPRWVFNRVKR